MAVFEFWRDITVGSPDDTVNRYRYDTSDDSVIHDTFNTASGTLGPIHPPFGTVMYSECDGLDLIQYKSIGNNTGQNKVTIEDSPTCCTIEASDFNVVKTNNTSLVTPNGTITVTAPVEDIGDYEVSIDGGDNWVTQVGGEITFEDLPAGSYSVIIRAIAGVCSVTTSVVIVDQITYPPLIVSESTQPALYSPVFHPIEIGFTLDNNEATIKEDLNGTYLEVASQDAKDYLGTLPIIKLIENEDYEGTYQVLEVDDPGNPTKFYIDAAFTTEQNLLFVPFDRQVFQLFAERSFNNYQKIADITVYPVEGGEYLLRLEGFLQAVFSVNPPVNNGDEITLLRKYYVVPRDFDMETSPTIYNAVYSAITPLTPYLGSLIPLGPAPINFINEQTQKGVPVLFSYIDTDSGRVKNVTSSEVTEIISTITDLLVNMIALDVIDVTWVNPGGAIADLQVDPALPDWITVLPSAADTVLLHIDTGMSTSTGDYDGSDYDGDDYLTGGPNAIVGCYEFEFSDGVTPLFTLRICVFPIQSSNEIRCAENTFNIAWVNREGGWSSYPFEGVKIFGKEIDEVITYKNNLELRRSAVKGVYDTVEVTLNNKSLRDLRFIASLRQSIQAYLYSEETLQWSIPIVLDRENFTIHRTPFKAIDEQGSFKFRYAEEILIQSQ